MVNAAAMAHANEIAVATVRHDRRCDYESLLRLTVSYKGGERTVLRDAGWRKYGPSG